MAIVLCTFVVSLIIILLKQKKINKEIDESFKGLINGYEVFDLTSKGGADEDKK